MLLGEGYRNIYYPGEIDFVFPGSMAGVCIRVPYVCHYRIRLMEQTHKLGVGLFYFEHFLN